ARDITAQKQAESRMQDALLQAQDAQKRAEEASQAKDEFLATVSHELRTPITAVLGWTSILSSNDLAPGVRERAVQAIDRNAKSQSQLTEDLLDVSRIVSGKMRIEAAHIDMGAVVAAAVEAVRPGAEGKGINIQTVFGVNAYPIFGD